MHKVNSFLIKLIKILIVSSTIIEFIHIIWQNLWIPYQDLDTNNEKDQQYILFLFILQYEQKQKQ